MADGTTAAEGMLAASSALQADLVKQNLDGAGIVHSASEGAQHILECLPLKEIAELPQLLSNLAVAPETQRVGIRARERKCQQLFAEVNHAHTQLERTSEDLKQGLTKLNACALEKVNALQGLPHEFTRSADLAATYEFSGIDLNQLQKTANVNDIQESISEVCILFRQVKERAGHVNEVLNNVLTFVLTDSSDFSRKSGWGFRACNCVGRLRPRPNISVPVEAVPKHMKEIAKLVKDARERITPVPDCSDAVDIKLRTFSASLSTFEDSVKLQLEIVHPVVEAAKATPGVRRLVKQMLAKGKRARGAEVTDNYRFGDVTRGFLTGIQETVGGLETERMSEALEIGSVLDFQI